MGDTGNGSVAIYINKREVLVTDDALDASKILTMAGFNPDDYSLFLVHSPPGGGVGPGQQPGQVGPAQQPGQVGPGQQPGQVGPAQQPGQVGPGQIIEMRHGLHFHAILKSVPYG